MRKDNLMKNIFLIMIFSGLLCACNTVNVKPNSLDKGAIIYTTRGGYTLRPAIKQHLQDRGYTIKIGKIKDTNSVIETENFEKEILEIPADAQYLLRISERSEKFRPIWCAFNGFWWWRFYISIVDQNIDEEILTWTGRGCANSTLRKMDKILDKLEVKE